MNDRCEELAKEIMEEVHDEFYRKQWPHKAQRTADHWTEELRQFKHDIERRLRRENPVSFGDISEMGRQREIAARKERERILRELKERRVAVKGPKGLYMFVEDVERIVKGEAR
jgi:hypothetical protein